MKNRGKLRTNRAVQRTIAAAGILLVLAFSMGCAIFSGPDDAFGDGEGLDELQGRYTKLVRWGEIERASVFVDPELREEYLDMAPYFDKVRFTDLEIRKVHVNADDAATVEVTYKAYSLNGAFEVPIREKQDWYLDDEAGWLVRPQLAMILDTLGIKID
jgi:hypothetical protein